jgi:hypothetical protein
MVVVVDDVVVVVVDGCVVLVVELVEVVEVVLVDELVVLDVDVDVVVGGSVVLVVEDVDVDDVVLVELLVLVVLVVEVLVDVVVDGASVVLVVELVEELLVEVVDDVVVVELVVLEVEVVDDVLVDELVVLDVEVDVEVAGGWVVEVVVTPGTGHCTSFRRIFMSRRRRSAASLKGPRMSSGTACRPACAPKTCRNPIICRMTMRSASRVWRVSPSAQRASAFSFWACARPISASRRSASARTSMAAVCSLSASSRQSIDSNVSSGGQPPWPRTRLGRRSARRRPIACATDMLSSDVAAAWQRT